MLLTVPAAVALAVVPSAIVHGLFERGAFTAADTPATANALAIFALGLPSFVLIKVFSPAYFAREDTRNADALRRHQPDRQYDRLGRAVLPVPPARLMPHLGIAVATTLGGWLNAGCSMLTLAGAALRRRRPPQTRPAAILLASVVMGAVLWLAADCLGHVRRRRRRCLARSRRR